MTGTHHVIFSIGYALQQSDLDSQRHRLGKAQSAAQPELPLFYAFDGNRVVGCEKRQKQTRFQLSGNAQSDRQTDENRVAKGRIFYRSNKENEAGLESEKRKISALDSTKANEENSENKKEEIFVPSVSFCSSSIWTLGAPSSGEKSFGKHPTQKPVALIERCLLASTKKGTWCWTRFWATAPPPSPASGSNAAVSVSNWMQRTCKQQPSGSPLRFINHNPNLA